jgi:chromosome segregation ATPase
LAARETQLNELASQLDQRETEIATQLDTLNDEENRLEQLRAELEEARDELVAEQEALQIVRDELEQEREDLRAEWEELELAREEVATAQTRLSEEWEALATDRAAIQEREARVNEREQRVEAYLRWGVVATVVSGVLAIPSTIALISLAREKQRTTQKDAESAQPSGNGHGLKGVACPEDKIRVTALMRENCGPNGGNGKHR